MLWSGRLAYTYQPATEQKADQKKPEDNVDQKQLDNDFVFFRYKFVEPAETARVLTVKGKAIAREYDTSKPGETTMQPEFLQEGEQKYTISAWRSAVLMQVEVKKSDIHLLETACSDKKTSVP